MYSDGAGTYTNNTTANFQDGRLAGDSETILTRIARY